MRAEANRGTPLDTRTIRYLFIPADVQKNVV
jgi:hypothetical protein